MTRLVRLALLATLVLAGGVTPSRAQGLVQPPRLPDPEATGRFRLGFVRFTPSVTITNLGVDTNVFNELEDPDQDFTASFGPKAEFWSRLGPRARIYGSAGLDYQYFREFDSQRSFGTSNVARLEVDLGRLTPFVEGTYTNTRVRPGFEIDARARRENLNTRAGLSARVQSRTRLLAWVRDERYRFDDGEQFQNVDLSIALDRESSGYGAGAHFELTPLTTFVVETEFDKDRFVSSPERDADSVKVLPGFRFKPFALIDGSLFLGYRSFETVRDALPDYRGFIANVSLGYTLRATRVTGNYNRDISYSYETFEPYYLQTDWQLAVTQKITNAWDVVGRGGRFSLDYETVGRPGDVRRAVNGHMFGGGIGYTLGEYVRLGFDLNYVERESRTNITSSYDGVRAGFAVTYGLKQ